MRILDVEVVIARCNLLDVHLPGLRGFVSGFKTLGLITPPCAFGGKFFKLHGPGLVIANHPFRVGVFVKPNLLGGGPFSFRLFGEE
ncbi:hypothetical protein D3C81_2058130 [compost metagenome]